LKTALKIVFGLIIGYWLGYAALPQKHIQHALDYPRGMDANFTAVTFGRAKEAHTFILGTGYKSLEAKAIQNLFDHAKVAEDYLYIVKVAKNIDDQRAALERAAEMVEWSRTWFPNEYICNATDSIMQGKKPHKFKKCINDTRANIMLASRDISHKTILFAVDAFLKNKYPPDIGSFAKFYAANFFDPSDNIQSVIEGKMSAIPATSVALEDWAVVISTKNVEMIAASKMIELAKTSIQLLNASLKMRFHDSAENLVYSEAIKKCNNFEECLSLISWFWDDPFLGKQINDRCLQFAKTKKQRKMIDAEFLKGKHRPVKTVVMSDKERRLYHDLKLTREQLKAVLNGERRMNKFTRKSAKAKPVNYEDGTVAKPAKH